jgi:hypothetical protein
MVTETIEIKFLQCENRLRDQIKNLIEPVNLRTKQSSDVCSHLSLEYKVLHQRIDNLERTAKFQTERN